MSDTPTPFVSRYMRLLKDGVPKTLPPTPFKVEDMFDELIADNQKTWRYDRKLSVGASEAFGCARRAFFEKRGEEFGFTRDPGYVENWGAMERGNLIENHHVVPAFKKGLARRGIGFIMAGDGQDTILDGRSSATLDGLAINCPSDVLAEYGVPDIESDCFVVEMKSFDPRIGIGEAKAVHMGQTQMQMGLIRQTTDYEPNYALIVYVQASWLDDIRCYTVAYDERIYQIGRARNDKVFECDDAGKFGPEGKLDNSCDYCPFVIACASVNAKRVPPKRETLRAREVAAQKKEMLDEIGPKAHRRATLKRQEKAVKVEIDALNEEIKQTLIANHESRAVGDDWKVSYSLIEGANRLSKDKLAEAGLDPDEYTAQSAGFEKLTVTTRG